eukprot:6471432-Amphidinium_carterae.1
MTVLANLGVWSSCWTLGNNGDGQDTFTVVIASLKTKTGYKHTSSEFVPGTFRNSFVKSILYSPNKKDCITV